MTAQWHRKAYVKVTTSEEHGDGACHLNVQISRDTTASIVTISVRRIKYHRNARYANITHIVFIVARYCLATSSSHGAQRSARARDISLASRIELKQTNELIS